MLGKTPHRSPGAASSRIVEGLLQQTEITSDGWRATLATPLAAHTAWVGGLVARGHEFRTLCHWSPTSLEVPERLPDRTASALRRWIAESGPAVVACRGEEWAGLRELTLGARRAEVLMLRLRTDEGPIGAALFAIDGAKPEIRAARDLLQQIAWAVAIAIRNAVRVADLQAESEARAAERSALLAKLGRDSLSGDLVGEDRGLREVMQRVELVRKSNAPVLLFGETGSGKEVVARAVHHGSPRREGPFVRVNCGAIPPDLIDSQLFGHEKGSFTGAVERRIGWFERANHGTLFLDEIAELSSAAQVRLLRVLQDGSLERVGGHETLHVDCRIIGATHRDLPTLVQEGRFREDLWYRLAVFPIVIPPLRERPEDLPALARHFAHRAALRFGLVERAPTDADLALLTAYRWPGNVRELAAVIDRAAILGDGKFLDVAGALGVPSAPGLANGLGVDRRGDFASPAERQRDHASLSDAAPAIGGTAATATLDDAQREAIRAALRRCAGRVDGPLGAAQQLKINPHTLRARMRKLGIDWRAFRPRSR